MGSGTTAIAAKKLNRHFIGVELSSEYVDLSKKPLTYSHYFDEKKISALHDIRDMGWIESGNAGGVGNTDLLGIEENAEWELKCQRSNTSSLTTLSPLPVPCLCCCQNVGT